MSILFDVNGEALSRTLGAFLSNGSNWTVGLWVKPISTTPSGGKYRTYFDIDDGTAYVFIGSDINSNAIQLYCSNGIDPDQTFNGPALTLDAWYYTAVTYDAASHVFSLYGGATPAAVALIGSLTLNFSTITFNNLILGFDGTANSWENNATEYYREWQRKLTLTEIQAEAAVKTAASATNLFTDTPLVATGTLTDLSGNAHTWVAVGAISYHSPGVFPPANNSSANAVDLTLNLPYNATVDTQDVDISTGDGGIWYKYTAQPGDTVIGFWAFGNLTGFSPISRVFKSDLTSLFSIASNNKPLTFPIEVGNTYYVQSFFAGGNVYPANIVVDALQAPNDVVPAGSIGINDDTTGFPLALLKESDGTVLQFINGFPDGELALVLNTGEIGAHITLTNDLQIFNNQYQLIATAVNPLGGVIAGLATNMIDKFYVSANGTAVVKAIDLTGAVVGTWTVTLTGPPILAVNQSGTVLYYAGGGGNVPIKRWDLVNDVALTDFAAAIPGFSPIRDILVLSNGNVIIAWEDTTLAPKVLTIKHFNSAGIVLNTIAHADAGGQTRLAMAIDDPNSFWLWTKGCSFGCPSANGFSLFENIKCSDGSILSTRTRVQYEAGTYQGAATATPDKRFGHSESCPLWIVRIALNPQTGTYSGVYQIVPNKTDDTVYTSIIPGNPPTTVTLDVEIP